MVIPFYQTSVYCRKQELQEISAITKPLLKQERVSREKLFVKTLKQSLIQ